MIDIRYLTVSEGTLKESDLISNFHDMLFRLSFYSDTAKEFLKEFDSVESEFKVDFLFDTLNSVAEEYGCYFSATEYDGALFTFLPIDKGD